MMGKWDAAVATIVAFVVVVVGTTVVLVTNINANHQQPESAKVVVVHCDQSVNLESYDICHGNFK